MTKVYGFSLLRNHVMIVEKLTYLFPSKPEDEAALKKEHKSIPKTSSSEINGKKWL
jgi:hypothetical protein